MVVVPCLHSDVMLRRLRFLLLTPLLALLSACHSDLMNPFGDVAMQQRDLLIRSTLLMMLIIVPVIVLTLVFAWRYRQSNKNAVYEPEWDHSTQLELVIWAAPLLIIICLGALTWLGTHLLDPYRPVSRLAKGQDLPGDAQTLQVEVVALDWKWLFIYPQYGVATVNDFAAPTNRPVSLHITSTSVMNSLYMPAFAGQVYAMPGMETKLHGVLNKTGESRGFSANYSGAGFSGMHFGVHSMTAEQFDQWIAAAKNSEDTLSRALYLQLAMPSEREPVHRYASVASGLYQAILNRCVEPNKMCMNQIAAIDAKGGLGLASAYNVAALTHDKYATAVASGPVKKYVVNFCTTTDSGHADVLAETVAPVDNSPLMGAGLTPKWLDDTAPLQSASL
jgi:cytochrome o ubiquinol oxidase subunit II